MGEKNFVLFKGPKKKIKKNLFSPHKPGARREANDVKNRTPLPPTEAMAYMLEILPPWATSTTRACVLRLFKHRQRHPEPSTRSS